MVSLPDFRELSGEEQDFVAHSVRDGCAACALYLGSAAHPRVPDDLDAAYEAWASDTTASRPADTTICYGLGALLGQSLVADLGFRWCMELADDGEIYCVRHPEKWQSYPFDFVGKRIYEREPHGGFFRALYDLLRERRGA